jgi:hypothetical protein
VIAALPAARGGPSGDRRGRTESAEYGSYERRDADWQGR